MARSRKSRKRPSLALTRNKAARKTTPRKGAKAAQKPSSREKVRAHRARLRAKGMRPITIWVPDMRSPRFAAEARRQSRLANKSSHAADDQAWVDAMSDWNPA
ncbi:MAG TPA: antitoxin MazE family protein [Pseudolabrys sp.]|nr:antitoxin MazE family protein [Pseudolabrys sp.]